MTYCPDILQHSEDEKRQEYLDGRMCRKAQKIYKKEYFWGHTGYFHYEEVCEALVHGRKFTLTLASEYKGKASREKAERIFSYAFCLLCWIAIFAVPLSLGRLVSSWYFILFVPLFAILLASICFAEHMNDTRKFSDIYNQLISLLMSGATTDRVTGQIYIRREL